jgi:hypothetical protein
MLIGRVGRAAMSPASIESSVAEILSRRRRAPPERALPAQRIHVERDDPRSCADLRIANDPRLAGEGVP